MRIPFSTATLLLVASAASGQDMTVMEYEPISSLVVPAHPLTRAVFPFVDIHGHQRGNSMSAAQVGSLVDDMNDMNMGVMINLSGGSGERLQQNIANLKGRAPNRFVIFANTSFEGIDDPGYPERIAAQLEEDVKNGAQGLKIFKNLGMFVTDSAGNRVHTDDPRLDPLWAKAGELGIPVLIHTADPHQFWLPYDKYNERWRELTERPRRKQSPEPSWETLMQEQWNVFRKHPNTMFISAHLAWLGQDLGRLARLFDELPNMHVGLGAVIYELGRQPRYAREMLSRYPDRFLMGKDSYNRDEFNTYFRVLETADDYFDYYRAYHAFWQMYGLDLPDDVLRKVYYENAARLIPGLEAEDILAAVGR